MTTGDCDKTAIPGVCRPPFVNGWCLCCARDRVAVLATRLIALYVCIKQRSPEGDPKYDIFDETATEFLQHLEREGI